jgi:hypothetical protein
MALRFTKVTDETEKREQEIAEWIFLVSKELDADAVGLFQIVPEARRIFGLEGYELKDCIYGDKGKGLIDCVRRHILALLAQGAKPVRGDVKGTGYWIEQTQYGTEHGEIADAIISEWWGWSFGDPNHGGLWFALPKMYKVPRPRSGK